MPDGSRQELTLERRDYNAILRIMNQIKNVSFLLSLASDAFSFTAYTGMLLCYLTVLPGWLSAAVSKLRPAPAVVPADHPTNPHPNLKMLK